MRLHIMLAIVLALVGATALPLVGQTVNLTHWVGASDPPSTDTPPLDVGGWYSTVISVDSGNPECVCTVKTVALRLLFDDTGAAGTLPVDDIVALDAPNATSTYTIPSSPDLPSTATNIRLEFDVTFECTPCGTVDTQTVYVAVTF